MNNLQSLFDLLIVDIETVPQSSDYASLPAEGQKLFRDKISKTVPEDAADEEAYQQRAGILAEFGKVICISTGFFHRDKEGKTYLRIRSIAGDDEVDLLKQFIALVDKFINYNRRLQFAGHNIREFDIPYLCRRMVINNITLPPYLNFHGAKPWEINMIDTLHWWRFGDYKHYTSLNLLACILGVPSSKDDIDGSMVQHVYYKERDLPRIARYCEKDVIVVARIIQRFMNVPMINDECIIRVE